ncbi:unnamed protein product [Rotaria sp. Silwood2]|nr:unnamed protein product [Rotaria sp. Silwood2]CAF4283064.1 unnamed protein product [Rotaria sp. Silwood2]
MIKLLSKNNFSHEIFCSIKSNYYRLSTINSNIFTRTLSHSKNSSKSNEKKSSSTPFRLFAPTVAEANLVSSFANWRYIPMVKDINTGIFEIPSSVEINDGEHEYKFYIRKSVEQTYWTCVIDPYVEKYDSKHRHGLITIRNREKHIDTYEWKHDDIKLPENDQLIIYEIYVADFTENGQFLGILSKLNHLTDLGINAIELLPIQDYMGHEHDWGYTPTHHFAIKASYGTKNDLKKLVDECHKRGIRVFFDGVFNHSSSSCPLLSIDKHYWYHTDKHCSKDSYYHGPEFNYDHYDETLKLKPAVKYARDIVQYWIEEFHLDGIRFDADKQLNNYNILHELDHLARSIRLNQPFFTQAEHVPETLNIAKENNGPVDACSSSRFHDVICQALIDQNKFELDHIKYVISASNLVNYLTSHNNERLLYLINHMGKAYDENDAFQRVRLGAIVLMTSVSTPLIWQGDEFGEARNLGNDNYHRKKLLMEWALMEKEQNKNLYNTFKHLIELRHKIINKEKYNKINFFYENSEHRILAYTRLNNINIEDIVVITNFANEKKIKYEIKNFPHNGQWIDWLTNDIYTVNNSILKLDLKPFDGKVLIKQK